MDEREWTDAPLAVGEAIGCMEADVTRLPDLPMWLITGDLTGLQGDDGSAQAPAGLADQIDLGAFSIRIGRDRLLAGGETVWTVVDPQSENYALSRADGLYSILRIAGPRADQLIRRGTSVDLSVQSPSAAIRFAGLTTLLLRDQEGFLLFVEAAWLTYLSSFFRRYAEPG